MTFLNPILVSTGLACIAIPILIHILMRRRRRPIQWGAMKFLLEAYRRQRRRMNFEQFVLLASRCALVALLALALGKPILAGFDTGGVRPARTVYLLIDNSIASGVEAHDGGAALDRGKEAALAILRRLDASRGDRAALVALGSPAEGVVLPASSDLSGVGEAVKQLARADSRADFAGAISLVRDAMRAPDQGDRDLSAASIVVLSELRAGSADVARALPALGIAGPRLFALAPAADPLTNVAITGVEPLRAVVVAGEDSGGGVTPVRVSLRRFGPGVQEAGVSKVVVEAFPAANPEASRRWRGEAIVRWQPGHETAATSLAATIPPAGRPGEVFLLEATIDRDVLAADNTCRRPVPTRRRLEVGIIAPGAGPSGVVAGFGPADWWSLALAPREGPAPGRRGGEIGVVRVEPSQLAGPGGEASLTNLDAIVIPRPDLLDAGHWGLLRRAYDAGALVIVTPPSGVETHTWTDAFTDSFALEWTLPRESRVIAGEGSGLSLPSGGSDLLGMIAPELDDLLRPARVTRVLPVTAPTGTLEAVLTLTDATPWVLAAQPGRDGPAPSRGLLVYVASAMDLAWTDIPTKPLMVPLAQELVRQGVGRASGSGVFAAGSPPVLPAGTAELARVYPDDNGGAGTTAVDAAGRTATPVRRTGVFAARGPGDTSLAVLAANADTAGSATDPLPTDALSRWLAPVGDATFIAPSGDAVNQTGASTRDGVTGERERDLPPISTPLLIAALCVALLELLFARLFSHAYAAREGGVPA